MPDGIRERNNMRIQAKQKWISLLCLLLAAAMLLLTACGGTGDNGGEGGGSQGGGGNQGGGNQGGGDTPAGTWTVSFTGEGVTAQPQTVNNGATAIRPKDPVHAGYRFVGWYVDGSDVPYDFTKPVTGNLTLVARWEATGEAGTEENPILITTAEDLMDFQDKLNHPDEDDNRKYLTAWYRLDADIDMAGKAWTGAGKITVLNEGEEDQETLYGFSGVFDGNGHTIRNLTINRGLRSTVYYMGLFEATYRATVQDLTLENISYTIISGGDNASIGACVGGVAGYADLSNFLGVRVTGEISVSLCASNTAYIGGIAGLYSASSSDTAYMTYVENCSSDVEMKNAAFDDGEKSVMESSVVSGGIIGYLSHYNCATAVLNCTAAGKVVGGGYAGGIIGYISGSYVSVINCANYASVRTLSATATYTGGIVGYSVGDNVLMDSYSVGQITGVKAKAGGQYKSYAGGILGYGTADDWDVTYSAGTAVVNCYYTDDVRMFDIKNQAGTAKDKDFRFTPDFVTETLHWEDSSMVFGEGDVATPGALSFGAKTYQLILKNGSEENRIDKQYQDGAFELIGEPEALRNNGSSLFFDWEHEGGVRYRFYVPVVKNMTLTARFEDSEAIAGVYTGSGTLYETKDAGALVLNRDGTLQWINGSVTTGSYTWDGYHILMMLNNNTGDVSGTFQDGTIRFLIDAGMSGEVAYTFQPGELTFVGEYFSPDGDSLSFAGEEKVTFRSEAVLDGRDITGTFAYDEETQVLVFNGFSDYFSSATAVRNADGSLTLHFVSKGDKGKNLDGVRFAVPTDTDHTGKPYVGKYNAPYISMDSSGLVTQSPYTIEFRADGTVVYQGLFSPEVGNYYVFHDGTYIVFSLSGYTSYLHYHAEYGVITGRFSRGMYSKAQVVFTPVADGDQIILPMGSETTKLIVTDRARYLVDGSTYVFDAAVTADSFADRARVTVQGVDYLVVDCYSKDRNDVFVKRGSKLVRIGAEEGTYTLGDVGLILDGIGGVTGDKTGRYWAYEDGSVVLLLDDDTLVAFRFAAAKSAGGKITALAGDGHQGIWYQDKELRDENDQPYLFRHYKKLVIDGIGHIAVLYYNSNSESYTFNWGGTVWSDYRETATGLYVEFNSSQKINFLFYYGGQLAYAKCDGPFNKEAFCKDGYTGSMEPATLPAGVDGKYTGVNASGDSVVFNLTGDLTGSYNGVPFHALYDGETHVSFVLDGVQYVFDTRTLIITCGSERIQLTRAGAVTEVIPARMCGTFSGTWEGGMNGGTRTVVIESGGRITYFGTIVFEHVTYDAEKGILSATTEQGDSTYILTLTWNAEKQSYTGKVEYKNEDFGDSTSNCSDLIRQSD